METLGHPSSAMVSPSVTSCSVPLVPTYVPMEVFHCSAKYLITFVPTSAPTEPVIYGMIVLTVHCVWSKRNLYQQDWFEAHILFHENSCSVWPYTRLFCAELFVSRVVNNRKLTSSVRI